jgi:hypothetical protein
MSVENRTRLAVCAVPHKAVRRFGAIVSDLSNLEDMDAEINDRRPLCATGR